MPKLLHLLSFLISFPVFAQYNHCNNGRLQQLIFSSYTVDSLQYGTALNKDGAQQNLKMSIFQPSGDTATLRPLVVMAFGGAFVNGQRSDLDTFCLVFAKYGYTAVTIDYRIGVDLNPLDVAQTINNFKQAAMRGTQDMRSALQFLYQTARNGNPYHIDTNYIISGGASSGAVLSMYNAYYKENLVSAEEQVLWQQLGGINNTTNAGVPSTVFGVINIVGSVNDTTIIQAGDPIITSCHGTEDETVPYGTGYPFGVALLPEVHGSSIIQQRATHMGILNTLYTEVGAGHTNINYLACMNSIVDFYHNAICNPITSVKEEEMHASIIHPNPVESVLSFFNTASIQEVTVFSSEGKEIGRYNQTTIDVLSYEKGVYIAYIRTVTGKIIRQKFIKA